MATNPIVAKLESVSDDRVELMEFARVCTALKNTLDHVSRCVNSSKKSPEVHVSELKTGSAVVGITPTDDLATKAFPVWQSAMESIENNTPIDERLDYEALKSFNTFVRYRLF